MKKIKKIISKAPKHDIDDEEEVSTLERVYIDDSVVHTNYRIFLDEEIGPPPRYREELQTLRTAGEHDTILIELNTDGGYLSTELAFIDAIKSSKAKVMAKIGPDCSSAGCGIALACDGWTITPYSQMMFHTASYGVPQSKEFDVYKYVDHMKTRTKRLTLLMYQGFLTEKEIDRVLNNEDFYFDAEELHKRFTAYAEYRQKQSAALQRESPEFTEEEVEFDQDNILTWPEGSIVKFTKAVSPFKKGEDAVIVGFVETTGFGELVEITSEDKLLLLYPTDFDKISFVEAPDEDGE